MDVRSYATPAAFKVALDARVRAFATVHRRPMDRVRTILVMERYLARIQHVLPTAAVLKGGLALELRLDRARTTKDMDLRLLGDPAQGTGALKRAAALVPDPDDFLRFSIEADPVNPRVEGEGVVYDGFRFVATAFLASRRYGLPFGVDVVYGDVLHGEPDELVGTDILAFIGVPPVRVPAYPPASHLAEKLHAYTLPRPTPNSRVKDLADIALLATLDGHRASDVRAAIEATFAFRGSHPVPTALPDPHESWVDRYRRLAREEVLPWPELADVLSASRAFVEPVLAGVEGKWDARRWAWDEPDRS
ncbi:MAG: nucleotidyl transferase AbiEii/AbiGii toxin family protein [Alphaproteobacteria bacterium]|nr:nucleotidyl transferase AbiEii/AbiGii toxin family protein [Alphaproteobacteria bacterium]